MAKRAIFFVKKELDALEVEIKDCEEQVRIYRRKLRAVQREIAERIQAGQSPPKTREEDPRIHASRDYIIQRGFEAAAKSRHQTVLKELQAAEEDAAVQQACVSLGALTIDDSVQSEP